MTEDELYKNIHNIVKAACIDCYNIYYIKGKKEIIIYFFGKEIVLPFTELLKRQQSAKSFLNYIRDKMFEEIRK